MSDRVFEEYKNSEQKLDELLNTYYNVYTEYIKLKTGSEDSEKDH
jgi:hypothetical protein